MAALPETLLRRKIVQGINKLPACHATPVENSARPGTPDVHVMASGFGAWVELKSVRYVPKRETTAIRMRHYTAQQRLWLRLHGEAGGKCGLLVEFKDEKLWLLFDWKTAQKVGCTDESTLDWMLSRASEVFRGRLDTVKLVNALKNL